MTGSRGLGAALLCVVCFAIGLLDGGCKAAPRKQVTVVDGVEVIVNPAVPLHKNPGRVLKVREKLRIRDTGDRFFFKYPERPEIGSRWLDLPHGPGPAPEVLARGGLPREPGQARTGPRRDRSLNRFLIEGDAVYAADSATNKVVHMTLDGTSIDDRRYEDYFETMTRSWVMARHGQFAPRQGRPRRRHVLVPLYVENGRGLEEDLCPSRASSTSNPPVLMRWDFSGLGP